MQPLAVLELVPGLLLAVVFLGFHLLSLQARHERVLKHPAFAQGLAGYGQRSTRHLVTRHKSLVHLLSLLHVALSGPVQGLGEGGECAALDVLGFLYGCVEVCSGLGFAGLGFGEKPACDVTG